MESLLNMIGPNNSVQYENQSVYLSQPPQQPHVGKPVLAGCAGPRAAQQVINPTVIPRPIAPSGAERESRGPEAIKIIPNRPLIIFDRLIDRIGHRAGQGED
ncbi:MAG: hypothetical protein H6970_15075 [Gammaproteobacteria bacterium]|nr:hypothetical protein [Gammaproteobacteria bacterium]